jgi:hypothetical protein
MLAGSIAPPHAFVHVVDFGGEVTVHGMAGKMATLSTPIAMAPSWYRWKISVVRDALSSPTKTEARIIEAARAPERIKSAIRG